MKVLLLIVGLLLILIGTFMLAGIAIMIFEDKSEYSIGTLIVLLVMLGIGPIVGGLFLYRRAKSQHGKNLLMPLILIVGILLIIFGTIMLTGFAVGVLEGMSEASIGSDIVILMLLGIGPIVGGLFLCRRALSQCGENRSTARNMANGEPKQELINSQCAICNRPIASIQDAVFCSACGRPVHLSCRNPGNPKFGQCAVCSATLLTANRLPRSKRY